MATNLTPEQLAELQRLFSTGSAFSPGLATIDGRTYQPTYSSNGSGENVSSEPSGYYGFDSAYGDLGGGDGGKAYSTYGLDGSYGGDYQTQEMSGIKDFAKFAAIAAALGGGMYGLGFGGGAGAGAGAAGAGEMVNGAFLGEAPWAATGGGALDFGAAGAAGAAGGAGAYGAGSSAGMQGLAGSTAAFDGAMAGGSGLAGVGAGTAAGGAGLLGKALGIGSTLLGAAAGAKGQDASSTQTKDIPEWLKPYITGQGGLLSQTQQQLTASRSPERMAQWDQMRNVGMGLLNQPIAGNPTTGWTFPR
jgi:hypothetical protein